MDVRLGHRAGVHHRGAALTTLVCVDPEKAREIWPYVLLGVSQAFHRGNGGSLSLVEQDVYSGHALIWLALSGQEIRACCITQLVVTDQGKKCQIVAAFGSGVNDWLTHLITIEKYARDEGCSVIELTGRKGWARLLRDYRQAAVVLEKKLD